MDLRLSTNWHDSTSGTKWTTNGSAARRRRWLSGWPRHVSLGNGDGDNADWIGSLGNDGDCSNGAMMTDNRDALAGCYYADCADGGGSDLGKLLLLAVGGPRTSARTCRATNGDAPWRCDVTA